jgi:bile acid-coenzyme A ligase
MVKFDAEETLRLIARDRVQWVNFVPTMMHRIWALPGDVRDAYDLSSLKIVFHMAAPMPPWLKENWIAWLGPERIFELYGGTERQGSTIISGVEWFAHKGSVAKIGETAGLRIIGDDGNDVPPGETGEIYFLRMTAPAPPITISALSRSGAPTAGNRWEISDGLMRMAICISEIDWPT